MTDMSGSSSEEITSGISEAVSKWCSSCNQVGNGSHEKSPLYWDIEDKNDTGLRPANLYGKFTWKIDNFSKISNRELRSNAFEVGGCKWYALIYPQGCDVRDHLSLFLCVADHEKLLPGWSHFAQFTIALVNKDPKKSKYSDTLHRFWKKEHDWGWKKFMQSTKLKDGFVVNDTLVIKVQLQVISYSREKTERLFRCLDYQYRRELLRVYLTNVEQICQRVVEGRQKKLGDFLEDSSRWSSFSAFWLGLDQNARHQMSREKTDVILKEIVKQFFVEKEVTSTLVMDSLYSGLKALECHNTAGEKVMDTAESPAPFVCVSDDMFTLADDVLLLFERAALEALPPNDERGPQNRTKDGNAGEDSIEPDERRLMEQGRRTLEIIAFSHILSNRIEVAYQEAVALKRQEELIREEEEALQAESDQKVNGTADKDKRANKKQSKQKHSSGKGKDKQGCENLGVPLQDKMQRESTLPGAMDGLSLKQALSVLEKPDMSGDGHM